MVMVGTITASTTTKPATLSLAKKRCNCLHEYFFISTLYVLQKKIYKKTAQGRYMGYI